jgi:predicted PurR-regulated permease PerM
MTVQQPRPTTTRPDGRAEWARLWARVQSIPPKAVGRGALAVVVAAGTLWLAIGTWPALLPFAIGGGIAYVVLPVVNALDTFLPRILAALVGVVLFLAALVGIMIVVLPPLAGGVASLVDDLPSRGDIRAWIEDLEASLAAQSGEVGPRLAVLLDELVTALRAGLEDSGSALRSVAQTLVEGAIGAVATVIGLLVLPTWILSAVREQRAARGQVLAAIPEWMRADAWAIVRIVDRAAATYLRGLVPLAVLVGVGVWLGLEGLERMGATGFRNPVPLAVLAGALQVVPEIGPLIGFLPALLILPISGELAVQYVGVYVASRWLASILLQGRQRGRRRLHPLLVIPAIVALTQFGLLWLFLAGPVLAITFDLVRYTHGRLSDPSRPAGVIPDEEPATATAAAAAASAQRKVVTAHG